MPIEMTDDEINEFLASQYVGRLGMVDGTRPYVVPISYAFHEGAVYFHSAPGMKVQALRSHPEVCFEVDDVASLEEWRSVIAWGAFEQLIGSDARAGVEILLDRFRPLTSTPGSAPHPGAEIGMMRTLDIPRLPGTRSALGQASGASVVFRLVLEETSGRREGEQ